MLSPGILGLHIGDNAIAAYPMGLLVQTQAGRGITRAFAMHISLTALMSIRTTGMSL